MVWTMAQFDIITIVLVKQPMISYVYVEVLEYVTLTFISFMLAFYYYLNVVYNSQYSTSRIVQLISP